MSPLADACEDDETEANMKTVKCPSIVALAEPGTGFWPIEFQRKGAKARSRKGRVCRSGWTTGPWPAAHRCGSSLPVPSGSPAELPSRGARTGISANHANGLTVDGSSCVLAPWRLGGRSLPDCGVAAGGAGCGRLRRAQSVGATDQTRIEHGLNHLWRARWRLRADQAAGQNRTSRAKLNILSHRCFIRVSSVASETVRLRLLASCCCLSGQLARPERVVRCGLRAALLACLALCSLPLATLAAEPPTYYVSVANPAPVAPYRSWETAATNIQQAIDAGTEPGRLVLVADGVYQTGSVSNRCGLSRVAVPAGVTVRSVNGPAATVIEGAPAPGEDGGNALGAIRCAYLSTNAILNGFTLTNGHTRTDGDRFKERSGGGAWCEWSGVLTNCTLAANAAESDGGGAYGGTLNNCTLTGNSASASGGGARPESRSVWSACASAPLYRRQSAAQSFQSGDESPHSRRFATTKPLGEHERLVAAGGTTMRSWIAENPATLRSGPGNCRLPRARDSVPSHRLLCALCVSVVNPAR